MRSLDHANFVITMKTDELLVILRKNRTAHASDYEKARVSYEKKAITALQDRLTLFRSDVKSRADLSFHKLDAPKDYTQAYDDSIKMLGHHSKDTFDLNGELHRCLVEDRWNWSRTFYENASSYSPNLSKDFLTL